MSYDADISSPPGLSSITCVINQLWARHFLPVRALSHLLPGGASQCAAQVLREQQRGAEARGTEGFAGGRQGIGMSLCTWRVVRTHNLLVDCSSIILKWYILELKHMVKWSKRFQTGRQIIRIKVHRSRWRMKGPWHRVVAEKQELIFRATKFITQRIHTMIANRVWMATYGMATERGR